MSQQELHEINLHCRPNSLLVVKSDGDLIRLFCPFQVIALNAIDVHTEGKVLTVTQVKVDIKLLLVYVINNKGYYYWNFGILI